MNVRQGAQVKGERAGIGAGKRLDVHTCEQFLLLEARLLDVSREQHAWQAEDDDAQFWIREAVDHACLTVWAGERASYIMPVDFATTAGRVVACVFHALRSGGGAEQGAADAVIDVVLQVTA